MKRPIALQGGSGTRLRRTAFFAVILLLGSAPETLAEVDRDVALRDMREIFAGIQVLLPLSVDDVAFRSDASRAEILAAFERVTRSATHAGDHIAGDDRRIHFLAGGLARATKEAQYRYERGDFTHAQFMIHRLSDFCVACHTRVPSLADSPLARGFVSQESVAGLPPAQRARLQVATRRFDDALATYEALFASDVRPAELLEPLSEYLRVAIRVKNDLDRPRASLKKFAARPDLWSVLRRDVDDWLMALDRFSADASKAPSIERAKLLLEDARSARLDPMDTRAGMVQRDLAASELHRYLERHAGEYGREMAEAYFLLGRIEGQGPFGQLVSESDFYLETAVRLAPHEPIGREAFELLEERAILGWTGSGGTRMPAEVSRRIETLRALVEASVPPAG